MSELPKTFDPAAIDSRWYRHWEETGAFRPHRPDAEPFTIVNPPPNVTGSLHIGHALDNTLQDILIRHARLQGKDALWVVGTDHAGIATQMVVERQLNERQQKRTDFTREEFVSKVWEWKAESGGQITRQLRRLGCSMDWSREQFTMDPHFSKAVIKVFVDLFNQGLLYRDKRLVNWDPGLKTAISDLEVETAEVAGKLWHFRYPLSDGSGHISVATTRPETMLADMAVAVSPSDPRYAAMVGKTVTLPITGRQIPIIEDEHADPELGSGAVKITPGHDFNDFEVGKRAGFKPADMLNMLDGEARIVQTADGRIPDDLLGLDRFEARNRVVEMIDAAGLLEKVEDRTIQTPFGDRSGVVIEPWLTDQWYVDAATLAKPAIEAVKTGAIKIVPKTWEKTWFNWMENIQPWCVSRQLWWGHRIPAWFDDEGRCYVAEDAASAQALAGTGATLHQDPDVLDTWFSSALWPFATIGWPEGGPMLSRHYPNDVLISGFDILFFWDARMAMQGLHFMKEVPWKTLYLHGLVRAADGQKMSKSKGNTVDPLGLIDQYGADALRFFMAAMESQGRDIKMDQSRVEGYRNFATKLWNAARFCQSNGIGASTTLAAPQATLAVNRWIIGETVGALEKLDKAFEELRFDGMADAIYHFAWGTFCDWYLELIKGQIDEETRTVAGWVLDQILVMLHPFMPFITEELWHAMGSRNYDLIHAKWPAPRAAVDRPACAEVNWVKGLIVAIRQIRSELGIEPKRTVKVFVAQIDAQKFEWLRLSLLTVKRMARLDEISVRTPFGWSELEKSAEKLGSNAEMIVEVEGEGQVQLTVDGLVGFLDFFGAEDLDAERARISKSLQALSKERDSLASRLDNPAFVEKAKPEAVEKARADHAEKAAEVERLQAALNRLG